MLLAMLHKYGIEEIPQVRCQRPADRGRRKFRFQHQADSAMSDRRAAGIVIGTAIGLLCLALPLAAQIGGRPTRPKVERPDGPVWEVIRKNCTACHGIDDYAFYALDRAGMAEAGRG